jgi:hypothetical protein
MAEIKSCFCTFFCIFRHMKCNPENVASAISLNFFLSNSRTFLSLKMKQITGEYSNKRVACRKLNSKEGNAKCRQLKKLTCKGTLRQVFIRVYRLGIANFLHTVSYVGMGIMGFWASDR